MVAVADVWVDTLGLAQCRVALGYDDAHLRALLVVCSALMRKVHGEHAAGVNAATHQGYHLLNVYKGNPDQAPLKFDGVMRPCARLANCNEDFVWTAEVLQERFDAAAQVTAETVTHVPAPASATWRVTHARGQAGGGQAAVSDLTRVQSAMRTANRGKAADTAVLRGMCVFHAFSGDQSSRSGCKMVHAAITDEDWKRAGVMGDVECRTRAGTRVGRRGSWRARGGPGSGRVREEQGSAAPPTRTSGAGSLEGEGGW
jgi:hypothetical protein